MVQDAKSKKKTVKAGDRAKVGVLRSNPDRWGSKGRNHVFEDNDDDDDDNDHDFRAPPTKIKETPSSDFGRALEKAEGAADYSGDFEIGWGPDEDGSGKENRARPKKTTEAPSSAYGRAMEKAEDDDDESGEFGFGGDQEDEDVNKENRTGRANVRIHTSS